MGILKKKIKTINELESIISQTNGCFFYGAGNICHKILDYLEQKNKRHYVKNIFVTRTEENPKETHGIKIIEYCEEKYIKDFPLIVVVLSSNMQAEILKDIIQSGTNIFVIDKKFEDNLDVELKNTKYICKKKILQKYVEDSKGHEEIQDIRFFSLPYWDAYSPFSAVPCLVARLQQEGYSVGQADLGILCTHWIIKYKWRQAADLCITREFYDQNVKDYKKNLYNSYEEFLDDMWFFKSNIFNVEFVKKKYIFMNPVQKRIVDAFYEKVCNLEYTGFDFEQCHDLMKYVDDYSQTDFLEKIISKEIIRVFRGLPQIIGLSVTSTEQFLPACLLAKVIKEIWPGKIIIMGGSCADLFIKSQYKSKRDIYHYFDYVIAGEGETSISMLLNYLIKGIGSIDKIPNLVHIDDMGNPVFAKRIVEEVDSLPVPCYEGLDLKMYLSPEPILPYQSSRGCHYGYCAFCNHDESYRHHYRSKDMKKVVKELIYLSEKYKVQNIQFVDEAIRPDCFRDMVNEMDKYKEFKHINWFFYSRVSRQYDENIVERAFKNGCKMVMFGVESFNQRLLNFIRKGIDAETSKYCLKLFHQKGIKTYVWLMCNLPSETLEEAKQDLESVHEMETQIDAFSVGPFLLTRNTDMYTELSKFNIISIDEKEAYRFMSHNKGVVIDKDAMLRFYEQEYRKYQMDCFSTGNRYTLFWESMM
ncbi:MAG: radical SAM protein [Coprococcus sp.]|nr:radical SAM protein [Coprococcus sp.]